MRARHIFCLGSLALSLATVPAAAEAACEPSFVDSSNAVNLAPSGTLDNQQIVERFYVRVRNDGDSACALRLGVSRDAGASDNRFPVYTLSGPAGVIPSVAAGDDAAQSASVTIPGGGQVAIPYDIRMDIGWGSEAGTYVQQLIYSLHDDTGAEATQRTQLLLEIPSAARIRFAGPQGLDGAAVLDIGVLSPDTQTLSPPFAIRVLSTAGYQMQLVSQNGGALVRDGGTDRIPYLMSVGGRPMDMAGVGGLISSGHHTSSSGDVHAVAIVVDPDPTLHAGDYRDRVTVTVTPI